jgi:hypothetical protein
MSVNTCKIIVSVKFKMCHNKTSLHTETGTWTKSELHSRTEILKHSINSKQNNLFYGIQVT